MRSILEIYKEYKIMPNLQMHMLRVAAAASLICDNFDEPLPKEEIVTACLLHDMGNILKSNFEHLPESWEPEGVEYWKGVKDTYLNTYGPDEHAATIQIMKKLGVMESAISLADQNRFSLLCKHKDTSSFAAKILKYADMRASPYGVVSYEERIEEAKGRYKSINIGQEKEREMYVACGKEMEAQIFTKCKIKPEDITEESVTPIISELKKFVVK